MTATGSSVRPNVMDHEHWMRLAIEQARASIRAGQSPFGAVVVHAGAIAADAHNEVRLRTDPTAHAEVLAIGRAAGRLSTIDLTGCTLYTTCEPCPMCASAAHWARLDRVVCGASIEDAAAAGFNELRLSARALYHSAGSRTVLVEGVLREACAALFSEWAAAGGQPY